MTNLLYKSSRAAVAALLLLTVSACAGQQSAPNMSDYSYVPPTKIITAVSTEGLEDF